MHLRSSLSENTLFAKCVRMRVMLQSSQERKSHMHRFKKPPHTSRNRRGRPVVAEETQGAAEGNGSAGEGTHFLT